MNACEGEVSADTACNEHKLSAGSIRCLAHFIDHESVCHQEAST